ncbi:carbon starvation CstA family protein [Anatilimnocola floriformis]|uniref:carbon starvation CstA family protein n=1 Tax=Anatilimnocola floriformis TaxID=2948575 RepID=UPI0020C1C187|nr:carbon starvation CstA family protein [Anatilimnocola floriformis]
MNLLWIVLPCAVILTIAYFTYGRLLTHLFQLDPNKQTPAEELNDGLDFEPLPAHSLLPQHFSAIAAAGPIVGPIVAGLTFGWLPALIWILIGSIFIGGVHDMAALVASIRHRATSIAMVVREHMSPLSYTLFLTFIWIALVYIIVAFTDVTAGCFIQAPKAEAGNVSGGAIASSSILYLILPIIMGLWMKYGKLSLGMATVIFVPLVAVAIYVGKYMPVDLQQILNLSPGNSRKVWDVLLLLYCLVAGMVPVWMLLQPRGHLGGYFLYAALGAGAIGLAFGGVTIQYPQFLGWEVKNGSGINTLFPALFIMIACGACSGFHSLIASGTTSKQLKRETDARSIGYGAMLMEAMVAIVSLCCVMMFAQGSPQLDLTKHGPDMIYAQGIGKFMEVISTNEAFRAFAISFGLMAFTTFVYDTLDVCTRLGRYILQELSGQHNFAGMFVGTALTAGTPLFFLLRHPSDAAVPVWRMFWNLFGASNQLLAALTLLGVTVWLWQTRRAWWVWVVTGIPTVWMYTMSTWALTALTWPSFFKDGKFTVPADPVPWAGVVLMVLAIIMLGEAIRVIATIGSPPSQPKLQPAAA